MPKSYDPQRIERKWQTYWEKKKLYQAGKQTRKKKFYPLVEFPYPSGAGLHTGHIRSYTAMDIIARKRRMEGYDVLYPMGWDAFGLPTENYAIKTGIDPRVATKKNTDTFRRQLKSLGFSFDWSREINTTDPSYYKWTQWIFLQLYKSGLAYKSRRPINWCLSCKIGLADEEVIGGNCERCGGPTEKREKEQWMLAITKYADRLVDDLETVDYIEPVKLQQRNWIGRSAGSEIDFPVRGRTEKITVFTTRADTLFGATYLVLAPEHPLLRTLLEHVSNAPEVKAYIQQALRQEEIERASMEREKTGVQLRDVVAMNPATGKVIPIFVADYALGHYGTGALMGVPAHDERDFEFANNFKIPVIEVLKSEDGKLPFTGSGLLVNSGPFSGMHSDTAKEKITVAVKGRAKTTYKLRDWVFSRQRYWGEPIPMIYCGHCASRPRAKSGAGWVPVPDKDLPVTLPKVKRYQPTDTGESPLASIEKWVRVKCPVCKKWARRETDTMPNWAGSSWYFLRYIDPKNKATFAGKPLLKRWMPVDWYNGGMEHTTLHVLYSRFWHKFLFDKKLVPTKEPYAKRTSHGLILAEGGEKMSKSKGNVVNPDEIVRAYGADTLRLYEMFMGPFDQAIAWDTKNIIGVRRFLERVWRLRERVLKNKEVPEDHALLSELARTIKKVGEDIESMKFNTAISAMMVFVNQLEKRDALSESVYKEFLLLLAPFAPHVAEELWSTFKEKGSIHGAAWPVYDHKYLVERSLTFPVAVNGKVKGSITVEQGTPEKEIEAAALSIAPIVKVLAGRAPKRVIVVPGRMVNIVL